MSQNKEKKSKYIKASDLYRFELLNGCELSPDGQYVLYSCQRVDKKTEKKYANLWIAPTDRTVGKPYQLTFGDWSEGGAVWSPDGTQIAFLSNRAADKSTQIYLLKFGFGGGEARQLTTVKGNIGSLKWSPDSQEILFGFRKKDQEVIDREKKEEQKKLGVVCYHYTKVFYKLDGEGYLPQERWGFATVKVKSGKVSYLKGDRKRDYSWATWSPDGQKIAFSTIMKEEADLNLYQDQIYLMDTKNLDSQQLTDNISNKTQLSYSPDGQYVAYLGSEDAHQWWQNNRLFIVKTDGTEAPINLTAKCDLNLDSSTLNDITGTPVYVAPIWSKDSQTIYFQAMEKGSNGIYKIDVSSQKVNPVFIEKGIAGALSFDEKQGKLAFQYGTMLDPVQFVIKDMDNENALVEPITKVNRFLRKKALGASQIEEIWFKGKAGNDLQGWIIKPPNFDPKEKYPSIMEIHGGPLCQYGETFMHEFFYLAAQGYVVYFCNPRGGLGYGEAHAKAIWGSGWGTADYDDLMTWADLMAAKPYIDVDKMGVTGGSYGGYMTNWIVGHTDRFRAAVTQRSVSNFVSMWGSSDFNYAFGDILDRATPFGDLDRYWEMSPIKYVANVKTPTLVIHSQEDHRCAIEQGEQFFVALKTLGVDTEFVIFPNEPHGLSRAGRTDRRIARLEHILRWMNRYLG